MEENTDIEDAEPARNTPSCCQVNHSQVSPRQLLKPLARICPQIIMLGTTMTQIKPYIEPSCPRLGDSMFNHHGSAAAGVGEGDAVLEVSASSHGVTDEMTHRYLLAP